MEVSEGSRGVLSLRCKFYRTCRPFGLSAAQQCPSSLWASTCGPRTATLQSLRRCTTRHGGPPPLDSSDLRPDGRGSRARPARRPAAGAGQFGHRRDPHVRPHHPVRGPGRPGRQGLWRRVGGGAGAPRHGGARGLGESREPAGGGGGVRADDRVRRPRHVRHRRVDRARVAHRGDRPRWGGGLPASPAGSPAPVRRPDRGARPAGDHAAGPHRPGHPSHPSRPRPRTLRCPQSLPDLVDGRPHRGAVPRRVRGLQAVRWWRRHRPRRGSRRADPRAPRPR